MSARKDLSDVVLQMSDRVEGDDLLVIHRGLNDYNMAAFPEGQSTPWAVLLRDDAGGLRGGLHAISYTGASMIVALWVEPGLRRAGWGRTLVERAALHAARSHARILFAEPTTFQAPAFWERTGFSPFGRLEGLAGNAALLEMGRQLASEASSAGAPMLPNEYSVAVESLPQPHDVSLIRAGVEQGAAQAGWLDDYHRLVIAARLPNGLVVGGLIGASRWGALHVETLWVHEDFRGAGLGRRLMAQAEAVALQRGCGVVYLETTSFQARPFYEKIGYAQTWAMEAEPGRLSLFGMHRRLAPTSQSAAPA